MSDLNVGTSVPSDDVLEDLLKNATPRPTPKPSDEAAVRQAVRAEWQIVSGRRQVRRRVLTYAIAAMVLVGIFSVFSVFRMPVVDGAQLVIGNQGVDGNRHVDRGVERDGENPRWGHEMTTLSRDAGETAINPSSLEMRALKASLAFGSPCTT